MNAKDLIQRKRMDEAEPQGGPPPGMPQRPRIPRRPGPPDRDMMLGLGGGPEDMPPGPGGPSGPTPQRGPFSPTEMTLLKEVLLLIATESMGNDYDAGIARKLIGGEVPVPGELQHILDEAGRIKNLPEHHAQLMQKVWQFVQKSS